MSVTNDILIHLREMATVNLFHQGREDRAFVGRPFYLDYQRLRLLSNDKWKHNVGGIPAGAFLLCVYDGEPGVEEAILVRVLRPTKLPTDDDVVASMVEFYKEALPTDNKDRKLDSYTRFEFQFSGVECRVLGTFYRNTQGNTVFAGDLDNFYSPNNYRVYKPAGKVLEYIVNFREDGIPGETGDERIGIVRYSSSLRHATGEQVPVFVSPHDFVGKRTALFGMTRSGKSNTVKKIIQSTVSLTRNRSLLNGIALKPIGQIVFDVNGEYANENQQDEGTAIFAQYRESGYVTRYSVLEKVGFRVMKVNFYKELQSGFELLSSLLEDDTSDYTRAFCSISWEEPDSNDFSAKTRFDRRAAAYRCCLHRAGFTAPANDKVYFKSCKEIVDSSIPGLSGVDPSAGISLETATIWFTAAWANYKEKGGPFETWKEKNSARDWADDDLQTLLRVLTQTAQPGGKPNESGFKKLNRARELHTSANQDPFKQEIVKSLRAGNIVIIDLSQGNPEVQRTYSTRICKHIFDDAMARFIRNEPTNFIQLYFEEAHNLFPRKEEKDLTIIYNRLAKEGAKLSLGLIYATQEVSSISSNVLKNTQNWFVSHLNNRDELKEIEKYYDFEDFVESLMRTTDKGFGRMKTYSNTFVVPVQIDRFQVTRQ